MVFTVRSCHTIRMDQKCSPLLQLYGKSKWWNNQWSSCISLSPNVHNIKVYWQRGSPVIRWGLKLSHLSSSFIYDSSRDAPILMPGISIGLIGGKKGVWESAVRVSTGIGSVGSIIGASLTIVLLYLYHFISHGKYFQQLLLSKLPTYIS